MFNFSKEATVSVERKRKHGERISVQSTAKAWRRYENVGRGVAPYGRKEKTAKRSQMSVGPDDDDVVVKFTTRSPLMTRSQKKHLLSDAIKNNILPPINRAKQCIKVLQFIDYFLHTECI